MWRDLRYAAQGLRRSLLFTITATLALGLAIGANAAIFGLVDGLWLRPPGVSRPGEIVWIYATTPTSQYGTWSFPDYLALRDRTKAFDGVVARGRRGALVAAADGSTELVLTNIVSLNFFTTLGVTAAQGRLFGPGDDAALEAEPGVVLGNAFWKRRFGGDPSIVGKTITLGADGGLAVRVLAVLPSSFRELDTAADRDLWMPPATWARMHGREEFDQPDNRWFDVVGRRTSGVSVAAAGAEVAALATALAAERHDTSDRGARVVSDLDSRLESGGVNALALLGLVLIVVLITCVNVANLLLARTAARSRELALRVAIGASRWHLVRQLMAESLALGAVGTVAGILVGMWFIRLLPAILVPAPGLRSFVVFETDGRVLLFTLGITLVTTVLFSVAPSLLAARTDVAQLMKGEPALTGSVKIDRAVRHSLVIGQIAVSLVLLYSAGVLARSFLETRRTDLGYARQPVLTAWAATGDLAPEIISEAARRLADLPGVDSVAVAIRAPLSLSGGGMARRVFVPSGDGSSAGVPEVKFNAVSANYFDTIGTRLVRGRAFTEAEARGGEPVMVASERFADRFFPNGDALGATVRLGMETGADVRIVGIAADIVINRIGETPESYFYLPYWRDRYGEATFLVRTSGDPGGLAPSVRSTLDGIDRRLEPRQLVTMAQYIDYSASPYQATAALAGALGAIGLFLTTLGVYGVIAYQTSQRSREIGIRVALGAARGRVLRLVLRDGVRVGLTGLVIGIPLAMLATRGIASMLFGVGPWSLAAFSATSALLLSAVLAATLIPAWRAARRNPSASLRE
jgi:putative ABC transport system permease protein